MEGVRSVMAVISMPNPGHFPRCDLPTQINVNLHQQYQLCSPHQPAVTLGDKCALTPQTPQAIKNLSAVCIAHTGTIAWPCRDWLDWTVNDPKELAKCRASGAFFSFGP